MTRVLRTSYLRTRLELRDAIHNLFVTELLAPSQPLWIVMPWIRDVAVVDNRTGRLRGLIGGLPSRQLRLREILLSILEHGGALVIATRPEAENRLLCDDLIRSAEQSGLEHRIIIRYSEDLHEKGICGDRLLLAGSMNLTNNGLSHLEESVLMTDNRNELATTALAFEDRWGRP